MFPHPARPTTRPARRWPTYHNHTIPQDGYTQTATVPLSRQASTPVDSSGNAVISAGPSGVGSKWYPVSVSFATDTGLADGSSVSLFYGYVSQATLLYGPAPGGQGITGLSVTMMVPGDLLVAQWINAVPGDMAQLVIFGTQDALVSG